MTALRVGDHSTRVEIEAAIAVLRVKAQRWSRVDPRRTEVDAEVDALVEQWMVAES
jgi:hypothetical protein